ncbi:MAG: response regulator [bacterium]
MENLKNVLVIDDEYYVCKSVQKILASEEIKTEISTSGNDGLSKARARSFDLAIVDVQMPEINGFEVVRSLRKLRPEMPVIITSGFNTPQIKEQATLSGAGDFIPKPFTPDEVLDVVARVFASPLEICAMEEPEPALPAPAARRYGPARPRNMKKAVAYICPIPLDYADDIISADEQKQKITKYALRNKLEIVAFYEDEIQSEDTLGQPAIQAIFDSDNDAGVFLCERIWCLSRKRNLLRPFLEAIDLEGIKLETATTMMDCVSQYARHWHKNKDVPLIGSPEAPDYGAQGASAECAFTSEC